MDENLKASRAAEPPIPSEADVVRALVEIERATASSTEGIGQLRSDSHASRSRVATRGPVVIWTASVAAVVILAVWGTPRVTKGLLWFLGAQSAGETGAAPRSTMDARLQGEAEGLLGRLAQGDLAAASQVPERAEQWTGKTRPTPKTDQFITASLNLRDLEARAAALQAQLALNGIPCDAIGFHLLEQAVGNPDQRPWSLWMLGALGNRGVDPVHAAKILQAYLNDPEVSVRTNVVIGLALLGTDETLPMLLDRFRNDPSPAVQELAGYGLAESGMYTHEQRMAVAGTLVGWIDDALLSPQQHTWTLQALRDISGQTLGTDSTVWRRWYESAR